MRQQIAGPFTSLVVVADRKANEKAAGLPTTVAVPHMLAAGWGGVARQRALAYAEAPLLDSLDFMSSDSQVQASRRPGQSSRKARMEYELNHKRDERPKTAYELIWPKLGNPEQVDRVFLALVDTVQRGKALQTTIQEPEEHYPLISNSQQIMRGLVADGHNEEVVVRLYIAAIAKEALDWNGADPAMARLLMGDIYSNRKYRKIRQCFNQGVAI